MTTTVERLEYGYVRVVHGEITSGGHRLAIHLAGKDDDSPAHMTYPTGYDSRCGWCWLGANHSEDAHREKIPQEPAQYADEYECEECGRVFDCLEAAEVHDNRHHEGRRVAAK